jgi:hypothetical protein
MHKKTAERLGIQHILQARMASSIPARRAQNPDEDSSKPPATAAATKPLQAIGLDYWGPFE